MSRGQGQLEAGSIPGAVDTFAARRAGALRLQQAHVFVEAHGPRRQIEFAGQVADGVGGCHGSQASSRVARLSVGACIGP